MNTEAIKEILRTALRNKFSHYNPESGAMPFHTRLLGADRLALYSFIHSLCTNFGTSIFEPVALALGQGTFAECKKQFTPNDKISRQAQRVIQDIIDGLNVAATIPAKLEEIERIRAVCQVGEMHNIKPTKVDLMLKSHNGELYFFDIKSAKPNSNEFKQFKRTLLEWVAVTLAENPQAKISTGIAIPYNPYAPESYARWTMRGMLDLQEELKVAEEFWDFLAGVGTYQSLLDCFEQVGIEMRSEIDEYFARFKALK